MHYTLDTDLVFLDKKYKHHRQEQGDLVYLFQFIEEYQTDPVLKNSVKMAQIY